MAKQNKFTKEQLMKSNKFTAYTDLLSCILQDGELYSAAETEKKIKEYMERTVE